MKAERSVEIARDLDDVWALLSDPSLMPKWFDDVGSFKAIEGDGTEEGDKYMIKYTRLAKPIDLRVKLISIEAPRLHVQRFEGLPAPFTVACQLAEAKEIVTLDAVVEVKLSLVQRALTPVIQGYVNQIADGLATGFQGHLET